MGGTLDTAVAIVRAAVYLCSLQAAGATLFLLIYRASAAAVDGQLRRLIAWSAGSCMLLIVIRSLLEPARMAGSLTGIADPFLQSLFWRSDIGSAQLVRVVGAGLLLLTIRLRSPWSRALSMTGVAAVVCSFALMGHTRSHDSGGLLGGLLLIHVASVAFWFGSLLPLVLTLRYGQSEASGGLLSRFSRLAVWVVAALVIAGGAMAWRLLASADRLIAPYGLLLLVKISGVLGLLVLAAINRYRLTPAIVGGGEQASGKIQMTIRAELGLMLGIFLATAWMTTFYSPE